MKIIKNEIKLICFDLDETLVSVGLNPMSDINQTSILKVQKLGISCVITTGRSYERSFPYVWSINGKFLIVYSGALIFEFPEKKVIWKKTISNKIFNKINEILESNKKIIGISYWLDEKTNKTITLRKNESNKEFEEHKISLKEIGDFNDKKESYVLLRFNLFGPKEELKKYESYLKTFELTVINNKNTLLEITNKDAKKSKAVEFLVNNKLKISFSEVMAFGDSLNDFCLFKKVKYGIAVENAQNKLKEVAFDVCESQVNSGVGKYLNKKILKE